MRQKIQPTTRTPLVMLLVAALLSSSFAQAGKPEWAGGKHEKPGKPHEEHERHEHKEHGARFFDEGARSVVIEYYGAQDHGSSRAAASAFRLPAPAVHWRL